MEYIFKFILAGTVVALASYISRKGDAALTSLLLMMPAGSLVGFYFVGLGARRDIFADSVYHTLLTLPLYALGFLLPLFALCRLTTMPGWLMVSLAFAVWLAGAVLYYIYRPR